MLVSIFYKIEIIKIKMIWVDAVIKLKTRAMLVKNVIFWSGFDNIGIYE